MFKLLPVLCAAALLSLSAAASPTDSPAEPALALTFDNPKLQWGACPPFLPKGCQIAVLHGDPSKPNVDVFFKVPGGSVIPKHTHTSAERMILVSGKMEVRYDGQPPITLRVGSYAYGPAKMPHEAVCAKGAPCVLFIAFESPLDAMPSEPAAKY